MSYPTAQEKKDATVSLIRERVGELGIGGVAKLYMKKLSNTFADGAVHGIQQSAKIPVHLVQHVLVTRQPVKYLYQEPAAQARIDASRAGKTIRQILTSPRKRRALCKAMRDSFQWANETVNLFNDFGDSFYFTTESGFPSNGGLVLFENTYDGHKGLCYQVCT